MKRIDIDVRRLPRIVYGGATHSLRESGSGIGNDVRIDPTIEIILRAGEGTLPEKRTLGKIIDNLVARNGIARISTAETDALGQMLGELVWRSEPPPPMDELWIATKDPLVAGLPWALAQPAEAESLIAQQVPVAVQIAPPRGDAGLPRMPKLLFVAGQDTNWRAHLTELSTVLGSECEIEPVSPKSPADLTAALEKHAPDILYYHGHGTIDAEGTFRFALEGSTDKNGFKAVDLRAYLQGPRGRSFREKLNLLYLNCCWSGVSLQEGGPFALGDLVPAFIANRASAIEPVVQQQAIAILKNIIVRGTAPHAAVHDAQHASRSRSGLEQPDYGAQDEPWWMTPTVFANYAEWRQTRPLSDRLITSYDSLRLDRERHCGALRRRLEQYEQRQASAPILLVAWHGQEMDGLDSLAERLSLQLQDKDTSRAEPLSKRDVAWPNQYHALTGAARRELLRDALVAALSRDGTQPSTARPADVAARARHLLRGRDGRAMWCQAPIDLASLGEPADDATREQRLRTMVRDFVAVLEQNFLPLILTPGKPSLSLVVLLRVGDVGIDAGRLLDDVIADNRSAISILSLRPLHRLDVQEIEEFLDPIAEQPGNQRWKHLTPKIAQRIFNITQGRYEPTRRALEEVETHLAAVEDDN